MLEQNTKHTTLKADNIERLTKYMSNELYLKIGYAQLISRQPVSNFDEVKRNSDLYDPSQHIRKILTTDNRVIEIKNFPQSGTLKDRILHLSALISDSLIPLDCAKPDKNILRLAVDLGSPFLIRLKLEPDDENLDYWESELKYDAKVPEECWCLWDCMTFAACTFDFEESRRDFGHKVRDVLKNIFKNSEVFYCDCIGPSPIHPNFIVPILSQTLVQKKSKEDEVLQLTERPFSRNHDIYWPILADSEDEVSLLMHKSIKAIYRSLMLLLKVFNDANLARVMLLLSQESCLDMFNQAIGNLMALQKMPMYKLIDRIKKSQELGVLVSKIHEILLEEYSLRVEFSKAMSFMDYSHGDDELYRLQKSYFIEMTEDIAPIDREVILSTLAHVEQELDRQSTFRKDLTFALMGAIVGAALTFTGAYLNSLFNHP